VVTSAYGLITRALRLIGEVAGEEIPTAAQATDGLEHLQDLMDSFKTQRLMVPVLLRTVTPLATSKPSYTIGTGGEINIARPETIEWARLVQDRNLLPVTEVPLQILKDQEWMDVRQKGLVSSYPQGIYFDHDWQAGLGLIYLIPIPSTGTSDLVLYSPVAFPEFSALHTTYTFPPGWNRALRLQLARELAPEYGRPWPPDLELAAVNSLADVKRVNHRHRVLFSGYPDAERQRAYNIFTDT
jgi:hypothetical protein